MWVIAAPWLFFYLSKLLFTLFLSLSSFKMWTAEKTLGLSESFLSTPLSMAVKCSFVWTHNRSQNPCQNMLRIPFRTQHFLYRARQIRSSKSLKDSCPPLYYIKRTTVWLSKCVQIYCIQAQSRSELLSKLLRIPFRTTTQYHTFCIGYDRYYLSIHDMTLVRRCTRARNWETTKIQSSASAARVSRNSRWENSLELRCS